MAPVTANEVRKAQYEFMVSQGPFSEEVIIDPDGEALAPMGIFSTGLEELEFESASKMKNVVAMFECVATDDLKNAANKGVRAMRVGTQETFIIQATTPAREEDIGLIVYFRRQNLASRT